MTNDSSATTPRRSMPTTSLSADLEESQRRDELFGIVTAGRDAGEVGVAQQIVHPVGVEVRTADQLAQRRVAALRIADDQREHVGALDLEIAQCRARPRAARSGRGVRASCANAEHALARVAERSVPDVVQEQRGADEAALIRSVGGVAEEARCRRAPARRRRAFPSRARRARA